MTSVKLIKKRAGNKQVATMIATKTKPAVKRKAVAKKELNSFLALNVGEATDSYLRGLALNQIK